MPDVPTKYGDFYGGVWEPTEPHVEEPLPQPDPDLQDPDEEALPPPPPLPPEPPPPPVYYTAPSRLLRLTSGRGDTILLTDRANGYRVRRGVRGLGHPPVQVQRRNGAGNGSRWQRTRWEERVIDLPARVEAEDAPTFKARLARLMEALDDRYGPPTLTVLHPDGTERSIEVRYAGGAEWTDGPDEGGPTFQSLPLTFVCPDPFFRSATPVELPIGLGAGTPFIPFGAPLTTSPSRAAGVLTLVNPGDADAYGVWTLRGPGGPYTIRSVTDNIGFTFTGVLVAGDVITIDTDAKTVVDQTGANRYADLGAKPRLWPIPPGRSTAEVTVSGSGTGSEVSVKFTPQWKTGS